MTSKKIKKVKKSKKIKKNKKEKLVLWQHLLILIIALSIIVGIFIGQVKFNAEEEDFLFLSEILKTNTEGVEDMSQRLQIMTDWLHENVKHGEYPPDFNGKGVANVIRGGMGNCGFQSCNIVCFSELLGYKEHRIIHNRREWGAPGTHTFSEINIDGKWLIYDPDNWQYIKDKSGNLVGIEEILTDQSHIQDSVVAKWISSTFANKSYKITPSWQETPLPFGDNVYFKYEQFGMPFFYIKKLSGKWGSIILFTLILYACGIYMFSHLKNRKNI